MKYTVEKKLFILSILCLFLMKQCSCCSSQKCELITTQLVGLREALAMQNEQPVSCK